MVEKAAKAVKLATEKMRRLNLEVSESGLKIEKLNKQLVAAGVEIQQTRDKANKLEERFTQVKMGMFRHRLLQQAMPCLSMNRNRVYYSEKVEVVTLCYPLFHSQLSGITHGKPNMTVRLCGLSRVL